MCRRHNSRIARSIRVAIIPILFDSTICLSSFLRCLNIVLYSASYRTPTADVFSILFFFFFFLDKQFCQPLHKQEYFRQLNAVIISYVVEPLGLLCRSIWMARAENQTKRFSDGCARATLPTVNDVASFIDFSIIFSTLFHPSIAATAVVLLRSQVHLWNHKIIIQT